MIIEVLSPSTVEADLGDKATEYLRLPNLLTYLIFSQDEPKAWVWVRTTSVFPAGPDVVAGHDGTIRIEALGIDLPLSEIYPGKEQP